MRRDKKFKMSCHELVYIVKHNSQTIRNVEINTRQQSVTTWQLTYYGVVLGAEEQSSNHEERQEIQNELS